MSNDELMQLKALAEAAADKSQAAEVQGIRLNNFKWAVSPEAILALIAKVESLSADAERMDWLDQNIFSTGMDDLDKKIHCGMWAWRTFAPEGVKGSARNIISSAMAKEKSK